jgi:hypothetical protein
MKVKQFSVFFTIIVLLISLDSCVPIKTYNELENKIYIVEKNLIMYKRAIEDFKIHNPILQDSLEIVKNELEKLKN